MLVTKLPLMSLLHSNTTSVSRHELVKKVLDAVHRGNELRHRELRERCVIDRVAQFRKAQPELLSFALFDERNQLRYSSKQVFRALVGHLSGCAELADQLSQIVELANHLFVSLP
jgi:hypothetical protein